jgi:hypothetical protein
MKERIQLLIEQYQRLINAVNEKQKNYSGGPSFIVKAETEIMLYTSFITELERILETAK